MSMRIIVGCGLAIGLFASLSGCVPAYYPGYPPYYARPAYPQTYQRTPAQSTTRTQPRSSDWVNPEPAR